MKYFTQFLLLLMLLLCPASAFAVIAYPAKRQLVKADGSVVTLTLAGDEHFSYYRSADGLCGRFLADGSFVQLTADELARQDASATDVRRRANVRRRARLGHIDHLTGKKKGIVILVNFQDNAFSVPSPKEFFTDLFNKRDNTDNGMTGSVSDYFRQQSYGKFELDFDVVGPLAMPKPMYYYGGPSESGANDRNPYEMIENACRLANPSVNFKNYDWDGDGYVDQVFVIYAGYGENYGASPNTIWPHESSIPDLELDGVKISTYACSCELRGTEGTVPEGIGTACHEFSHCLGFPDMYNTESKGSSSLFSWEVMDQGSYNNNSRTPAGYTSYERWQAGWLEPVELTAETTIQGMKPLVEAPEAYILYNEANRDEYYLLENRQLVGFDAALSGHGLLVLHVDFSMRPWESNKVNAGDHERLSVIGADGRPGPYYTSGDPFPGPTGNTSLTDYTSPAATLFNPNTDGSYLMHKSIENITESADGRISFLALRPDLAIPAFSLAAEKTSFTATWPAVDRATGYELRLTEYPAQKSPAEALTLEEDFKGTYKSSNGFTDIGSSLNKYTTEQGFTGSKLYQSPNYLLFGSSKENGVLKSPVQRALETGQLTIVMKLKPYTNGTEVTGNVNIVTNNKPTESIPLSFTTEQIIILHPETVLDEIFRVDIQPVGRCFISYLAFYDGDFSAEDLGLASAKRVQRRVKALTYTTTDLTYSFADLNPTCTYTLEMRSMDAERTSLWSAPMTVDLKKGDDDDAIHSVLQSSALDAWYDLNGRKVAEPQHGIYIHGGQKVVR